MSEPGRQSRVIELLPHDLEAERAVLDGMLLSKDAISDRRYSGETAT